MIRNLIPKFVNAICSACSGAGRKNGRPCGACNGSGTVPR